MTKRIAPDQPAPSVSAEPRGDTEADAQQLRKVTLPDSARTHIDAYEEVIGHRGSLV